MFAVHFYASCFDSRGNLLGKKTYDSIGKRPFTGHYLCWLIPCLDATEKGLDGLKNLDPFHDIDPLATNDSFEEVDGNDDKRFYFSLIR